MPEAKKVRSHHRQQIQAAHCCEPAAAQLHGSSPQSGVDGRHHLCATDEGWLYLAVVLDLFSRQVVGWSMQPHMQSSLVTDALRMAWVRRAPNESVVFHPDRGNQYCGHAFQPALAGYQTKRSMNRKSDCWMIDNAALRSRIDNWFERMVIMTSVGECEDRISIKAFGADDKGEFPATDLNHTELEACCKVKLRITC